MNNQSGQYILVINCGSSSLKWALFDRLNNCHHLKGLIEAIGTENITAKLTDLGTKEVLPLFVAGQTYGDALNCIKDELNQRGIVSEMIFGVGHRVVHAGESFSQSALIDKEVLKKIEALEVLAPLHNPANLVGIEAAQEIFPDKSHVAVFDTSFHQTIAKEDYLYPISYELYEKYKVRRYGFHGTSHCYVLEKLSEHLNRDVETMNIITAHLGNGASLCAIKNGQSVQTTMGLTPLDGLMMGTRSGAIDPGIFDYLARTADLSIEQINTILNKKSGILGISGQSHDLRIVEEKAFNGDKSCQLALAMFAKSIASHMMKMSIYLENIDAIVFTGGIGENSQKVRALVMQHLTHLNVKEDYLKNQNPKDDVCPLHQEGSLPVYKVTTDEEAQIAKQVIKVKGKIS